MTFFIGAHSVRPQFRDCPRLLRCGSVGSHPAPGVHPKGPRAVPGRAAARAAPTEGCREEEPNPAGRSGTGPYGGRNAAGRADRLLPRYRVFVFHGADMHRSPHRISAFRRGGYYPPAVLEPRFGWGGYVPPAAPDNVFCRGAQCAPAIPRLSTTPPTCNVGATPRPEVQPKGPRGVLRRAAARAAPTGGCREEEPNPAGRSGTGPYGGAERRGPGGYVPSCGCASKTLPAQARLNCFSNSFRVS